MEKQKDLDTSSLWETLRECYDEASQVIAEGFLDALSRHTHKNKLQELTDTEEAVYIEPFSDLPLSKLQAIMDALTVKVGPKRERKIVFSVQTSKEQRAFDWTLAQFAHLGFEGLEFFTPEHQAGLMLNKATQKQLQEGWCAIYNPFEISPDTILPFCQCLWCGRLDMDLRGKRFFLTGKAHYCHVTGCNTSSENSGNLSSHKDNCCFRKYGLFKKRFKKQLQQQKTDEDKRKVFKKVWGDRFKTNLKQEWDLRNRKESKSRLGDGLS